MLRFGALSFRPMAVSLRPRIHAFAHPRRRLELRSYRTVEGSPDVDLDVVGKTKVAGMDVEVIDPVEVCLASRGGCVVVFACGSPPEACVHLALDPATWELLSRIPSPVRRSEN